MTARDATWPPILPAYPPPGSGLTMPLTRAVKFASQAVRKPERIGAWKD
jgi:hypothetical protein